jgi:hypothetical protein
MAGWLGAQFQPFCSLRKISTRVHQNELFGCGAARSIRKPCMREAQRAASACSLFSLLRWKERIKEMRGLESRASDAPLRFGLRCYRVNFDIIWKDIRHYSEFRSFYSLQRENGLCQKMHILSPDNCP